MADYYEDEDRYNFPPRPSVQKPVRETPSDTAPNPQSREAEPWWWDLNNGSPPSAPLGGGMQGWNWDGSRWWQTPAPGISGVPNQGAPPATPTTGGAPAPTGSSGGGGGAVAPIPPASLPGNVQAQFDKAPQRTPIQSAYQDALLGVLGRSQQTPSLEDPTLAPQAEVYRVTQQRNQERNRRSLAERAAANNMNQSGYLDRQIEKGIQEQHFNTAAFNANLLGGEMTKRRNELLAALQLASTTGNQEAERELRERLAQVNTMMQQQGLNLQGSLGFGDLALRALLGQMGNDQFYDALGINTGLRLEDLNQNALRIAMGGG